MGVLEGQEMDDQRLCALPDDEEGLGPLSDMLNFWSVFRRLHSTMRMALASLALKNDVLLTGADCHVTRMWLRNRKPCSVRPYPVISSSGFRGPSSDYRVLDVWSWPNNVSSEFNYCNPRLLVHGIFTFHSF